MHKLPNFYVGFF